MAPWSFTTFNTSESTSTRPPVKPLRTLEQIIIRQLCLEQRRRTSGQVCRSNLPHSEAVGTGEQKIAGPGLIKFRAQGDRPMSSAQENATAEVLQPASEAQNIVNGVNVTALFQTIDAVKANP